MANIFLPFQVIWGTEWGNTCKVERCSFVWYWLKYSKFGKGRNQYELFRTVKKKLEWRRLHLTHDLKDGLTLDKISTCGDSFEKF